jgi:molybdate transport system substrate-binding protein
VLAASSLREALPKIDPLQRYSFAGSDQLALQIREGAPADVYAAASTRYPDELFRAGLVERPRVFATNRLVLVVPRSNPGDIDSVWDLRAGGLKIVIGQAGVPIGDYTREALRRLGLLADVVGNVVSEEPDVKSIVAKVALGEADAGFVYLTDVRPAASRLRAIELPARAQPRVRYEIAVVRKSPNRAAARAFVARVLGNPGRRALTDSGFGLP